MDWIPQILPFPWFLFLLFSMMSMWVFVCLYGNYFILLEKPTEVPTILHCEVNKNWLV